jgi:gustatory receptor
MVVRFYSTLLVFVICGLFVAPIVKYISTGIWINKLPTELWFPFDPYNPKFYTCVFVWQALCSFFSITALAASDPTFISLCVLTSLNFGILGKDLEESEVTNQLINRHQELLEISENLQKIFSKQLLFFFLTASLIICLISYQLSVATDFEIISAFAPFFMGMVTQVFLYCYHGQKIIDAGGEVAKSAYESKWFEKSDKKIKAATMMITIRAQKCVKITLMSFFTVSKEQFVMVSVSINLYTTFFKIYFSSKFQIISASYSYFMFLKAVY